MNDDLIDGSDGAGDGATSAPDADQATEAAQESGTREIAEMRDKYLRLAAEYDNYRKRTARESSELGTRSQAALAKQLIDALDDLGRVAHVDPATSDVESVITGVELVEKKFLKALGSAGLEILDPVDQVFNPELHEAITTVAALSPEDDHMVAQVFQPGYAFRGQLLRPARVVVKQWNG
ncbi:MAG: nucleotide exchange factor GrpE [Gemmatimonadota bacterium]|nr:nucleotide exchange factor GrpE [Gemmatimonadota bacterium]